MEITQLYQGLTFLAWATFVIVILVGGMLFKVLWDFSKLQKNLNDTLSIVKTELIPTMKNINKSVEIISNVIIKTDEQITKVKDAIKNSPLGLLSKLSNITGTITKGFFSGLKVALKIFSTKK